MITISDICQECENLKIKEKREISEEYAELVFLTEDVDQWVTVLASFLGQPLKPAGVAPTPEQLKLADAFGGLYRQQTLFAKETGHSTIIAMFWPWGDGVHTTLKLILTTPTAPAA